MNKIHRKKATYISLLIAFYIILLYNLPRFTGWTTLVLAIVTMAYFSKKHNNLMNNKRKKRFAYVGIALLLFLGSNGILTGNQKYQQKLMAEKAKQEQIVKQEQQKKIEEKKQAEEQKKIAEEEAKKKALEKKKQEEVKKRTEEQKKKEEENKRKEQEEQQRVAQESQRKSEEQRQAQTQTKGEASASSANKNLNEHVDPQPQEGKVVITVKGKKYHNPGCSTVKQIKQYVTPSEAKNMGYSPCKKCNP